jgi:hypothetical protein
MVPSLKNNAFVVRLIENENIKRKILIIFEL